MYCWQESMRSNHPAAAYMNSIPTHSSNRSFYNILMPRQPCYQPMFSNSRDAAVSRPFDYPPCAKPTLSLGGLASPSRIDETFVYQDPSPEVISSLPVYFRVKPTLRTPSGRRCRKSRTVFSDMQLKVLEKTFVEQRYLDTTSRSKLAQNLGLNETQVKTWFQNRRMKWKKESKSSEKEGGANTKTDGEIQKEAIQNLCKKPGLVSIMSQD